MYRENAVSEKTAQKWFKRFKEGNESLGNKPRSGRQFIIEHEKLIECEYAFKFRKKMFRCC